MKELVHGDFKRTRPSLSTWLEADTDILALDVEEVYQAHCGRFKSSLNCLGLPGLASSVTKRRTIIHVIFDKLYS